MDDDRALFEQWAAAKEFDIRRISEDAELWPGVYMKNHVHLMWLAWQAALDNERTKRAATQQTGTGERVRKIAKKQVP
jgi:hypothetical protein